MSSSSNSLLGVGLHWAVFWAIVLGCSAFFTFESIEYLPYHEDLPGQTLVERRLWVYVHGSLALPILFVAPLQFHPMVRTRWPQIHRWTGRIFILASVLAGALAVFLSLEYPLTGSRPALMIFGLLWIFFSASAWFCATQGDFAAHRAFMIRSVTIGFAFVWVRMLRVTQDYLFPFIEDAEMRTTVREYVCFIIPLVAVEIWLTYYPTLKRARARRG